MKLGVLELVIILFIVLLFVGPKQLPKITAAISESYKTIKKDIKESKNEEAGATEITTEE